MIRCGMFNSHWQCMSYDRYLPSDQSRRTYRQRTQSGRVVKNIVLHYQSTDLSFCRLNIHDVYYALLGDSTITEQMERANTRAERDDLTCRIAASESRAIRPQSTPP
jgi:hypothetical protein